MRTDRASGSEVPSSPSSWLATPVLTNTYHAAEDRALFADALAKRVATMAAASGSVADPNAHGQRLAALVLPDVIECRPDLPMGFSFASQNGRHPAGDTTAVVETVLMGAVTRRTAAAAFQLSEAFPYIARPATAV